MLPGKKYTPEDIGTILLRRRWLILVPLAIGLALAPLLAQVIPELYRSETLILVVPQRVPDAYVKPTVTETVANRLPAISEQILSRSRLERIITELDLYKEERKRTVMEDIVLRMRETDINLGLAATGRDDDEIDSFRISYVNRDPTVAQRVTERLASMTIDQNVRDRSSQAESTNLFLERELATAKSKLVEHEKKLEDYKRRHPGQLPSQLSANLQAISSAQLQLQTVSESINRARERRLLYERSLANAQALPPVQPTVPGGASEGPVTAAQQLAAAQAQLEATRLRYTPDHPDVRTLERLIADLTVKATEESSVPRAATERPASREALAYEKQISELKAELEVIDLQLVAYMNEEKKLKQTISDYQSKIDALPSREAELVELTRDYETLDAGYRSLLQKWGDSKIASNLEQGQIGEQFEIVDQASLPQRPFNQMQRLAVTFSGGIVGLVLGFLIAGFLEYRDSTFTREEDIVSALSLPVLALVPALPSERERQVQRRKALAVNAAGAAVLVGSAVVLVLWRL